MKKYIIYAILLVVVICAVVFAYKLNKAEDASKSVSLCGKEFLSNSFSVNGVDVSNIIIDAVNKASAEEKNYICPNIVGNTKTVENIKFEESDYHDSRNPKNSIYINLTDKVGYVLESFVYDPDQKVVYRVNVMDGSIGGVLGNVKGL